MAEIINKLYGGGLTGYEALAADIQKLWDFSPVETATNANGLKTTTLWINENTNIKVIQRSSYSPQVYVTYKGALIQLDYNDNNTGTSTVQMYGVKTNRGMVMTLQDNSKTLNYYNRYIMIGDAENPHTGDIEKAVGLIVGNFVDSGKLQPSMLASDNSTVLYDAVMTITTRQKNSIVFPYTTQGSSFVMQSIYCIFQTQSTPFFGECTFNGRKFQSVGVVLIEDD